MSHVDARAFPRWDVLLYPVTSVLAFVLLLLRRPDAIAAPRLWAEDGTVFYAAYLVGGPIRSLFEPINGFLDFIPRLLTDSVGFASAAHMPAFFAIISLVGTALSCGFFALPEYRYFLRSDHVRIACCLAFAAVPYAADAVGNLAILPWFACIPTMLLLALPRRGYNGRPFWFMLGAALFVSLTALSAPALVVFVPLALFKIYKGTSRVRIVSGAFLIAIVVQLMVYRVSTHGGIAPLRLGSLIARSLNVAAYQVMLDNLVGRFATTNLSSGHVLSWAMFVTVALLTVGAIYIKTRKEAAIARRLVYVLGAAIASIVITCVATNLNSDFTDAGRSEAWQQARYLYIPIALFYYIAARVCDDVLRRRTTETFRALAFVALVTIAVFSNFRLQPLADDDWPAHAALIDEWHAARSSGGTHSALDLPINPPGWTISLPALQAAS